MECKVCNKMVSGPVPYMDHIKSAKHLKRVQDLEKLEAVKKELHDAIDANSSNGTPEAITRPSPSLKHQCEVCKVWMNSAASLQTHFQGKRHQRAVAVQRNLQKIIAQNPMVTSLGSGDQHPGLAAGACKSDANPTDNLIPTDGPLLLGDTDLSCDPCGIVLFKSIEHKLEHLETDGHRLKTVPLDDQLKAASENNSSDSFDHPRKKVKLLSSDDECISPCPDNNIWE